MRPKQRCCLKVNLFLLGFLILQISNKLKVSIISVNFAWDFCLKKDFPLQHFVSSRIKIWLLLPDICQTFTPHRPKRPIKTSQESDNPLEKKMISSNYFLQLASSDSVECVSWTKNISLINYFTSIVEFSIFFLWI